MAAPQILPKIHAQSILAARVWADYRMQPDVPVVHAMKPAKPASRVWLFDLDDTLHDASSASFPGLHLSFGDYIQQHLNLTQAQSDALRATTGNAMAPRCSGW